MTSGSQESLLYNFSGHRDVGGGAPSNGSVIAEDYSKEEICGGGTPQEEMSAILPKEEIALGGRRKERTSMASVGKGLSLRPYRHSEAGLIA